MLGVISDTHDSLEDIRRAVELFNSKDVELVVHAGDYVAPFTIKEFGNLNAKLVGVFGNNDGERRGLQSKYRELGARLSDFLEFEMGGKRLAVYHGTVRPFLDALIGSGKYDVVICGHTHRAEVSSEGRTLVVNPGESCGYLTGKKTVCLLDLESLKARIVELE